MIIIPARLASTRLKDKILLPFDGSPLFIATAKRVSEVDDVVIAVDDERVLEIAKEHGFNAVLTSKAHKSGTDRICEAAEILGLKDDELIINVQADEPLIEASNITAFKLFCQEHIKEAFMFSCFKKVDEHSVLSPDLVKVVCDKSGYALYFSRSILPYPRERCPYHLAHLGIYGYTFKSLKKFCTLSESMLENSEKLEQLRALENGEKILLLEIRSKSIGIDNKDDYQRALSSL